MAEEILHVPPASADERRQYGPLPAQFYEVYQAPEPMATIIMIHGGFWRNRYDLRHCSRLCVALSRRGFRVLNLEYRRVGDPGGGWPGTADDVLQAVYSLVEPNTIVVGHSAGGHLALWLATQVSSISAVVALAPVACLDLAQAQHLSNDAVDEFLGGKALEPADPSRHAARVACTLLHGARDTDVPLQLSQEYIARRRQDRVAPRLLELTDADHFDLIDPRSPRAWPALLTVLQGYAPAQLS